MSKCSFMKSKVDYLGYEISFQSVQPGERKINAVKNYPHPKNVHELRQFLGLAGYFRKFICNFSIIALPLTRLLKKDVIFVWDQEQETAFNDLKLKLVSQPTLAIYDHNAETELHTDASKYGIGGILLQRQLDDKMHPIAYYSRTTCKEEQRYHSYELETLAVVNSLKHFRVYLLGLEFKIFTDCNSVRSAFAKRDLVPRIGRWWLSIQDFNFSIEYRPGVNMSHVDALSRNSIETDKSVVDVSVNIMNVSTEDWILAAQLKDERCKYIYEILNKKPIDKEEKLIYKDYKLHNNRIYRVTESGKK